MAPIDIRRLLKEITQQAGCTCETYDRIGNDETICIPGENLPAVLDVLMNTFDCKHLTAITAQQREGQLDEIEVLYHFWKDGSLSLMMTLPAANPELPSIVQTIPGADFYEREAAEMFGVTFTGREETPPLLLPEEWDQGPPFIRKEQSHE